ncbi:hypothetical protein BZG04_08990 [Salinivibrio kushneri]|uniref:Lipoprotein n=2 Tax=Salinivibrio kushneri TaxID=1908198 RepID=A0AB36K3I3_9GAMM|nr:MULTISPECIES: DUF6279 family lipoprotein [Salinivibrio]ODP97220.1 hypothetical protein BGL48_02050 [Salinivibrio sp. BNH]OOE35526.1 hypothetical protein BZG04_08990 [Salinivibrio kushneri]OOE41672.1 hypothetical protein BZG00_01495 [Salinivibrio kushneri]OOE71608.1 hypothetical protein BZG19_01450 [Salinivibrio kushneri]QCP02220.1 hypothetical protein FCN78_07320 [Salinivibrio kushneri]
MVKQGCRTGWLAGCLLLLVGCTTELAYNTLPFWIHYYIDDIVNLRPEQSRQVKADLDKIQQWHRTHELPAIAERLGLIATQSTERQTMAQLRDHQEAVKERIRTTLKAFIPATARLLDSFDDEQAQALTQWMEEEIEQATQRRAKRSEDEQFAYQRDDLEEDTEEWVGDTDRDQQPLFAEMAQYQQAAMPTFRHVREQLVSRLFNIINNRQSIDTEAALSQWVDDVVAWRAGPETETEMAIYRSRRLDWLLRLDRSLDDAQRNRLVESLNEWQTRLRDMSR